jgi:beta-glucanase (GH16 family)
MKKTVLISLVTVAIVTASVWNVMQSTTSQSGEFDELTLANIEALTQSEGGSGYSIASIIDAGSTTSCINGNLMKTSKYNILCSGEGSIPCSPGEIIYIENIGTCGGHKV